VRHPSHEERFTFIVLMIGRGVVAVPTGLVASALSKAREEEETG